MRVTGTATRSPRVADRSFCLLPTVVTGRQRSAMYDGASLCSALYVSRHSLNWTRCETGSQWRRSHNTCLMCSCFLAVFSEFWRWRNCWLLFSWRRSTGLEHSSLFGVIEGSIGWLAGWCGVQTRVWKPAGCRDGGPSMLAVIQIEEERGPNPTPCPYSLRQREGKNVHVWQIQRMSRGPCWAGAVADMSHTTWSHLRWIQL